MSTEGVSTSGTQSDSFDNLILQAEHYKEALNTYFQTLPDSEVREKGKYIVLEGRTVVPDGEYIDIVKKLERGLKKAREWSDETNSQLAWVTKERGTFEDTLKEGGLNETTASGVVDSIGNSVLNAGTTAPDSTVIPSSNERCQRLSAYITNDLSVWCTQRNEMWTRLDRGLAQIDASLKAEGLIPSDFDRRSLK
ncbi:hypothetical protein L486_06481 [Kwoniella mangroviensis CBS 10435]|uniref:Uncharacterized protein n=1 Tax=Kwoniella mangroviensis CBS 10435 TaxID=1331196 RepID=A0A1B9IK42_9TREE|nr:uncharacterized protein I203_05178 [Kwoniella mangroviensis CBS 8507]OCF55730.1 hypothetical protein L486_06481 [Kwoniella mangroviensis CBS 10435]OCF65503.1 hypothetical protein I203_05178 [Kwoniella mangroviensis CBS 8507]OCF71772.1 hypothetical protein I204_07835 [Kwoniella mangroviensis CBS 8886]